MRCRYRLPRGGAAAGTARLHVAQEVQHQGPDPGRAGVQSRPADAPGDEKGIETVSENTRWPRVDQRSSPVSRATLPCHRAARRSHPAVIRWKWMA